MNNIESALLIENLSIVKLYRDHLDLPDQVYYLKSDEKLHHVTTPLVLLNLTCKPECEPLLHNFENCLVADCRICVLKNLNFFPKDFDPMQEHRPQRVRDREGTYRAQLKNRIISPERYDPFANGQYLSN